METKTTKKPKVKLSGKDGNVFMLVGLCSRALKSAGLTEASKEMIEKVFASKSYEDAICIMGEYCDIN